MYYAGKLIKKLSKEQEKIITYSEKEIFKVAKENNLITQDNFEYLEKYFQYRQDYFTPSKKEVSLEKAQEYIKTIRDIYLDVKQQV